MIKYIDHKNSITHPGALTALHSGLSLGKFTFPSPKAMAGPAAIPSAPDVTKSALAAVRSALLNVSAMYRRLMERALLRSKYEMSHV
jgi:hypothetical protein